MKKLLKALTAHAITVLVAVVITERYIDYKMRYKGITVKNMLTRDPNRN